MRMLRLAVLVLTSQLAGCSLLFVSGPPPDLQRGTTVLTCTTSVIAPVLDLAWVAYTVAAVSAEKTGGMGGADYALSSLWVGSAAYGFWKTSQCRSAIDEANRAAAEARALFEAGNNSPLERYHPSENSSIQGEARSNK